MVIKSILSSNISIVILSVLFVIVVISMIWHNIYGTEEKDCINFSNSHLIIISQRSLPIYFDVDGCDWLVGKILENGSGFHLDKYKVGESKNSDYQRFVLTK